MTRAAFDTETFLIRPGLQAPPMVCLTVREEEGGDALLLHARPERMVSGARAASGALVPAPDAATYFAQILERSEALYGVNTAYDTCVLIANYPQLIGPVFEAYERGKLLDVSIHEKLIDIGLGLLDVHQNAKGYYSLAGLSKRYLKKDRSEEKADPRGWRLRYSELWDVDVRDWPAEAVDYALVDAIDPLEIAKIQEAKYAGGLEDSARQARADFCLKLMSCWGVRTNPKQIGRLEVVANEAYARLREVLVGNAFIREGVNPDTGRPWPKSKQGTMDARAIQHAMVRACENAGLSVKLTPKGQGVLGAEEVDPGIIWQSDKRFAYVRTDLEACEESLDEGLVAVAQFKKARKIVDTEVPDLRRGTILPIQPQYNVLVASGRTSCRKGKSAKDAKPGEKLTAYGYQVQNPLKGLPMFPPGVGTRECFEARPGSYFIDNDVTGLELSTVAEVCLELVGESQMADLINRGTDPHLWFGAKLAGVSYEHAVEHRHTPEMKKYRSMAKPANFGLPGGMGPRGFQRFSRGYGIHLDLDEAASLIADWKAAFPEFGVYFKYIDSHIGYDGEGVIEQLFVKRYRKARYTALCNTMFQGLGADVMKHALWLVAKGCYVEGADKYLYGVRPWGFVHDEILAETTSRDRMIAHQQAFALARVMETGCNHYLRRVPIRVEPALSLRFCKAESVYDADGMLVPWDVAREARADAWYGDGKKVVW